MLNKDVLSQKFKDFLANLSIDNQEVIANKLRKIVRSINQDYWNTKSDTRNVHYIGSYGRGTAIKGINNINVMIVLPPKVFQHFDAYQGNGQMALMQELRDYIGDIYSGAYIHSQERLLVPLNGITFEIIPAFLNDKKNYVYPELEGGGRWKVFNPIREMQTVDEYNYKYNGKVKHLARMMRAWRNTYDAPISGMLLDTLVLSFIDEWEYNHTSYAYYGNMTRDFLEYMAGLRKDRLHWYAKGSNRKITSMEDFGFKANIAYEHAEKALDYENQGDSHNANTYWKQIYGEFFPADY